MPPRPDDGTQPPRARPSRRELAKRRKLARIEETARRLFATRGYDGTTTRAIAAEAGIGVGTLFLYFKEKRDLAAHLLLSQLERGRPPAPSFEASGGAGGWARRVEAHLLGSFAAIDAHPELARAFIKEAFFMEDRTLTDRWTAAVLHPIVELLRRAQRAGRFASTVDPDALGRRIFALYYVALVRWCGGRLSAERRDAEVRASVRWALGQSVC